MPPRLEASIERAVVEYAKKRGVTAIKLSTQGALGTTGWPDRLFLGPENELAWVEFKTEKGKLTPLQKKRHEELLLHGWFVVVVRSVAHGKEVIDRMFEV